MFHYTLMKFVLSVVEFDKPCNPNTDNPSPSSFFSFPHWWKYINTGTGDVLGTCTPTISFANGPIAILEIGLAVIDMLLYAAGLVAVAAIIIAGISYITAAGNAEQITSSRKRIQNALIGLAIVFVAVPAVSFIGNSLG